MDHYNKALWFYKTSFSLSHLFNLYSCWECNKRDESNKKRKIREKQPSEQQSYYKNFRKEQKKRKKRTKRLQEVEGNDSRKRDATIGLSRTLTEKKRSLDNSEKHLTRGKKMVSSTKRQKKEQNKKEGLQESAKKIVSESSVKKDLKRSSLKELASDNLTWVKGTCPIGSGTFWNCYQGTYRGIAVVIKKYKEKKKCSWPQLWFVSLTKRGKTQSACSSAAWRSSWHSTSVWCVFERNASKYCAQVPWRGRRKSYNFQSGKPQEDK